MKLLATKPTGNRSLRAWLFGVVGLCGVLALPASADSRVQVQFDTPGLQVVTYGHDRNRNYNRHRHNRGRYNRRNHNRAYHRGYRQSYHPNRYSRYNRRNDQRLSYGYSGTRCQRVSKRGYWRGRPALIGGRECLDRRGAAYIAPNSRYLIRYH